MVSQKPEITFRNTSNIRLRDVERTPGRAGAALCSGRTLGPKQRLQVLLASVVSESAAGTQRHIDHHLTRKQLQLPYCMLFTVCVF